MTDEPIEKSVAVQPYRATAQCPYCGGELKATGIMLPSHPPMYQHECTEPYNYEHEFEQKPVFFNLDKCYPVIEYREL